MASHGDTDPHWRRVDEVFATAVELPPAERQRYLGEACGDDSAVYRGVLALLAADEKAGDFLDQPLIRAAALAGTAGTALRELGRVGRIRLLEPLGKGGMGEVYVGFDETLERTVAVKGLRHDRLLDEHQRALLLREAKLLSRLNHKNICQIYDVVESGERHFLVLELIEGRTLAEVMREGLDERLKMKLSEEIAAALAAAHGQGILHRDLKPANVMVTPDGEAKVLDFGVGRMAELDTAERVDAAAPLPPPSSSADGTPTTLPGRILGTLRYMSPEQARGEPATTASDMFTFGLLLQELWFGVPPYEAGLPASELLMRAGRGESLAPTGGDSDLLALTLRLKSLVPAGRPTAVDTLERLRWIREAPRRRTRRRLTAVALLAMAAATAVMALLAWRLAEARDEAAQQARVATAQRLTAQAAQDDNHLDRALLLALEAHHVADTVDSRSGLLNALERSPRALLILRHPDRVLDVAWSPDSTLLASASNDGMLRLWEVESGRLRGPPIAGHGLRMWKLAWSPDGTTLASAGFDGSLHLWDVAEGRLKVPARRVLEGHGDEVWGAAWSPDGRLLASVGKDGTLRLWDAASGEPRGPPAHLHPDGVWDVDWSPDGRFLVIVDLDQEVRLVDARTLEPLGRPFVLPRPSNVYAARFSPDGTRLAVGDENRSVTLFDVTSRRLLGVLTGHEGAVKDVAWSPDGERVVSAGSDRTLRLWDVSTGLPLGRPLRGHGGWLSHIAWSPDGRFVASASSDRSIIVWNVAKGVFTGQPLVAGRHTVVAMALDPTGKSLVSSDYEPPVVVWDLERGAPRAWLEVEREAILSLAWGDRHVVAGGSENGRVYLWDADRGRPLRPPVALHESPILAVAWSPDGRTLASVGLDALWLWDVDADTRQELRPSPDKATAVAWSPDGKLLAVADRSGPLRLWDGETGRLVGAWDAHPGTTAVAWKGDGTLLASGADDGTVLLWRTAPPITPASPPFTAHADRVTALAWSPGGELLASGGEDKTVRLWDSAAGGEVARITSHEGAVRAVTWTPDGAWLVSSSQDGTIRLRDVRGGPGAWREQACRRAGRNLSRSEWDEYLGPDVPYRRSCPEQPPGEGGTTP